MFPNAGNPIQLAQELADIIGGTQPARRSLVTREAFQELKVDEVKRYLTACAKAWGIENPTQLLYPPPPGIKPHNSDDNHQGIDLTQNRDRFVQVDEAVAEILQHNLNITCERLGVHRKELACPGLGYTTLNRFARGEPHRYERKSLMAACERFGISPADLLSRKIVDERKTHLVKLLKYVESCSADDLKRLLRCAGLPE